MASSSVGYNVAARSSGTKAAEFGKKLADAQQIMATGQRVNDPSKDPAAAAVGALFRSDTLVLEQLVRNVNTANSVLSMMQGAMSNAMSILTQLKAMGAQAQDPTLSSDQLGSINGIYVELLNQMDNINSQTQWLGVQLFGANDFTFQIGLSSASTLTLQASVINISSSGLGLDGTDLTSQANAQTAYNAVTTALGQMSSNIGVIAASQTRFQTALDSLTTQLASERFALDTTIGADINETLNDTTTYSTQLQIAQAMLQAALEQQKTLGTLVQSASR